MNKAWCAPTPLSKTNMHVQSTAGCGAAGRRAARRAPAAREGEELFWQLGMGRLLGGEEAQEEFPPSEPRTRRV